MLERRRVLLTLDESDAFFWADKFRIRLSEKEDTSQDPQGCLWLDFAVDELGVNAEDDIIEGYIKWDGCSSWSVDSLHLCGPEGGKLLDRVIRAVYFVARPLFSHCDYSEPSHDDFQISDPQR